jgi:predicted outer membrane protein
MTTITVQAATRPVPTQERGLPRGARWAAAALLPLFRALQGRRRAPAVVAREAEASPAESGAGAQARRVREATRVRRYAMELAAVDSRVAAELLAACDRHERGE